MNIYINFLLFILLCLSKEYEYYPQTIPEYGQTFVLTSNFLNIDLYRHSDLKNGTKINLEISFRYNNFSYYYHNDDYGPYNLEYDQQKYGYLYKEYQNGDVCENFKKYIHGITKKRETFTLIILQYL